MKWNIVWSKGRAMIREDGDWFLLYESARGAATLISQHFSKQSAVAAARRFLDDLGGDKPRTRRYDAASDATPCRRSGCAFSAKVHTIGYHVGASK